MASFAEPLVDELKCPICTDLLSDPKALHCLHRFCRDCLESYIRTHPGWRSVSCPVCRKESRVSTSGVINADSFVTDVGVRNVVQTVKKTREDISLCDRHTGNPVVLYCKSCEVTLCHVCSGMKHRGCEGVVSLQSAAAEERKRVTAFLEKLKTKGGLLEKTSDSLKFKTEALETRRLQEIKTASERFDKVHQLLRQSEVHLINEINKEFGTAKKGYQLQGERLRDEIKATTDAVTFVEDSLTKSDIQLFHLKCQRRFRPTEFEIDNTSNVGTYKKAKSLIKQLTKLSDIEKLLLAPPKSVPPTFSPVVSRKRTYPS